MSLDVYPDLGDSISYLIDENNKLQAEVEATKSLVERLIEAGNALDIPPDDFSEEQKEWRAIVAEWHKREVKE